MFKTTWKIFILPATILSILAFGAWTVFDYGRYRAGFDNASAMKVQRELGDEINDLQGQLSDYRSRLARLESSRKVDSYANTAVKGTLAKMEEKYQELREELQFYRAIVSPDNGREGLHIHDFTIMQRQTGEYNYNLTLVHIQGTRKHHRESSGVVHISVEGLQGGIKKKLEYANINTKKRSKIRYRFKYFARLEGGIKLPKGFTPQSIEIQVIPRQKKVKGDTRKIKWPAEPADAGQ